MDFKQQRFVFNLTDEYGNVIMYFPVTSIDYVEGAIKDISVVDETLTIAYVDGSTKVLTGIAGGGIVYNGTEEMQTYSAILNEFKSIY